MPDKLLDLRGRASRVIEKFNIGIALLLIAVTAGIGYAMGAIFAVLWNGLHK